MDLLPDRQWGNQMSVATKVIQATGSSTKLKWYALLPDSGATYDEVAISMGAAVFDEVNNLYFSYYGDCYQRAYGVPEGLADSIMSVDTSDFSVNWNRQYGASSFEHNNLVWSEVNDRLYALVGRESPTTAGGTPSFAIINPSTGAEVDSESFRDSTATYQVELYAGAVRPADGHCMAVGRLRNQLATSDYKGVHMELYGASSITSSTSYTFENVGDDIALGSVEWSGNDDDFYAYGMADNSTFSASRINSTGPPSGSAYIYTVSTIPAGDAGGAYVLAIDGSSNRFVLHVSSDTAVTNSVLTCFNGTGALNDTSPTWSVRLDYNIGLRATGCLGTDGNLYIATNNGTIIQVDTSDGSLLNAMYIPSPIIWDGYADTALYPYSQSSFVYGTIASINSNASKIYITFSGSFVSSSMHGNILVIPEEDFGEEFVLAGGSGLLTYAGAAHTTVTPTYSYTAISNTSETINALHITNSDNAVTVPNSFSTVTKSSSPIIIIPLSRDHEAGGTATNTVNLPDDIEPNSLAVEIQENDVVVYISACGNTLGDSTSSSLVTTTSGYTTITSLDQAVTTGSCMVVGWKRMGATPDTSIALPESQVATNGQAYLMFLIRGLSSDTDVIDSFTTEEGSAITSAGFPAITPTGDSFVVTVGTMGYQGTRYVTSPTAIDLGDYDSLVNFSGNVFGTDTYDCSTFYATTNVAAGETFTPSDWSLDNGATPASYVAATIAFKK